MRHLIVLFNIVFITFFAACTATTTGGSSTDPCNGMCTEGLTACEEHDGAYKCVPVDSGNGDPCGGNCQSGTVCVTDADGSSHCDVQGGGGNGTDCGGVCGAGTVCQNGGCVLTDGGGTTTPPPTTSSDITQLKFTVHSPGGNAGRIDYNYGYCSDTSDPKACHAWIEPACYSVGSDRVVCTVGVEKSGVVRFNASYYDNANGSPNRWLCEGASNPHLTASVQVEVVGGPSYSSSAVKVTSFSNGCSAYVLPAQLIP